MVFNMKKHQLHQLEYSVWSCRVSWCPVCHEHYYNDRNIEHTTIPAKEHYHVAENDHNQSIQSDG